MNGNNDENAPTWSSLINYEELWREIEREERRVGESFSEMDAIHELRFEDTFDEDVDEVSQGLTSERIDKFEHFTADESLVGEQCLICMNDLEIGIEMVRLDCHVDHILCKVCVEKWFKNHKTCPTCRHAFK